MHAGRAQSGAADGIPCIHYEVLTAFHLQAGSPQNALINVCKFKLAQIVMQGKAFSAGSHHGGFAHPREVRLIDDFRRDLASLAKPCVECKVGFMKTTL